MNEVGIGARGNPVERAGGTGARGRRLWVVGVRGGRGSGRGVAEENWMGCRRGIRSSGKRGGGGGGATEEGLSELGVEDETLAVG